MSDAPNLTRNAETDHRQPENSGMRALCGIAGYYRIAANPESLLRE